MVFGSPPPGQPSQSLFPIYFHRTELLFVFFSSWGSSSFLLRLFSNCEESHSLHSRVLTRIAAFNMEAFSFPSSLLLSPPSHHVFFRVSSPGPKKVQFTTGKFLAFSENRDEISAQRFLLSFLVQSMSLYIDMNMMRSSKFCS